MPKRPENADDAGGRPAPRQKAEEQHTDNEEEKRGNDRPYSLLEIEISKADKVCLEFQSCERDRFSYLLKDLNRRPWRKSCGT